MPPWTLPAKFDMSGVIRMVIDRRWRSSPPLESAGSAGGGPFDVMVTSPPDALTTADHHTRWPPPASDEGTVRKACQIYGRSERRPPGTQLPEGTGRREGAQGC